MVEARFSASPPDSARACGLTSVTERPTTWSATPPSIGTASRGAPEAEPKPLADEDDEALTSTNGPVGELAGADASTVADHSQRAADESQVAGVAPLADSHLNVSAPVTTASAGVDHGTGVLAAKGADTRSQSASSMRGNPRGTPRGRRVAPVRESGE